MAEDKSLYKRLKKMFSTGVIVRRVGDKKLKVADTAQIQSSVSNAARDRYFKLMNSSGYGTSLSMQHTMSMAYQQQRIMLFRDYDIMDSDSIIHPALDLYAEESTLRNENDQVVEIDCDDDNTKEILENLFYDILNVEHNLYMWVRNICKYGDMFLFMEIVPDYGIVNVLPLSVYDTVRVDGADPEKPYYYYFETRGMGGKSQKLESYEVAHFRLLGDANFLPFGMSMLEGARRVFRQLVLMEDAMLIHRIMRAPEKRIFKIDVGNIPPSEVPNFMKQQMNQNKKVPFIDEQTGQYNYSYNMQNLMEDFYLPVRGSDSGTTIENLGGLEYNAIDDIEYLRTRMLASLKIPKAYLGFGEDQAGKLSLSQEDVRFARTIERIQRMVESELYKMGIVHLYSQGFTDERLVEFKVKLTNPSTIYEQEKINLWKERTLLARDLKDLHLFSTDYIYQNFYNLSESDIEEQRAKIVEDGKREFRLAQIEQGMSDPVKFGFPQNKSPEELAMMQPGMDPSVGGMPGGDMPPDPADQGAVPTTEAGRVGRPEKGSSYGQDNHYAGRDPLGTWERYEVDPSNVRHRSPNKKKRSPMTMESAERNIQAFRGLFDAMDKKFKVSKTLNEDVTEDNETEKTPSYMDENIIITND